MVEFSKLEDAVKAKKNLNGTFIYANCCSLRVDFGKADKLLVNDETDIKANVFILHGICGQAHSPSFFPRSR